MEDLALTLSNLQPIIIFAMLLSLWVVESFIPFFTPSPGRKKNAASQPGHGVHFLRG